MSNDLSEKEIKQNLEFLQSHLPPRPTAVDGFYKLPENFSKTVIETYFSQSSLQRISDHIGYFLGILKPIKVNFVEESSDPRWIASNSGMITKNENGPSVSGLYRVMGYDHSEILLIKKNKYQLKHVLAILAHEYTHHYLHEHNVRKNDRDENEILTEVATAYLGLGQFLVDGYKPIVWTSNYYNYVFISGHTTHTMTLGYVPPHTIKKAIILATELRKWEPKDVVSSFSLLVDRIIVYFKLWPYRSEVKKVKRQKEEVVSIKNELDKMVENYKNICLDFDKISKNINLSSISKDDSAEFVKLANELSLGEYKNKITNFLKTVEDSKSENSLKDIKKEKNKLGNQTSSWQRLLNKYK